MLCRVTISIGELAETKVQKFLARPRCVYAMSSLVTGWCMRIFGDAAISRARRARPASRATSQSSSSIDLIVSQNMASADANKKQKALIARFYELEGE